jgi:phosphoribosyl-AMP cyclohydrolase / phosphoribosyl-ATP pyrophosphohydrolase
VSEEIRFGAGGLVPAIIRDIHSGAVLMLAWMNEESLRLTRATGETHFWSRSRNELWHKGATSGNRQRVRSISLDCDRDTLLIDVEPLGAACHTGELTCFGDQEADRLDLHALMLLLRTRRAERPAGSYSTTLFDGGVDRILKKVGEEATEVVIAAKGDSKQRLVEETADLLFHLTALLVEKEVSLRDIAAELARRGAKSGLRTL